MHKEITWYQEHLRDHYYNPRNKGTLENPTIRTGLCNPSCGDSVFFDILIQNDTVQTCMFEGKGCVISMATASLLTEYVGNKTLSAVQEMTSQEVLLLLGIELGPTRLKCALLSLEALQKGICSYRAS